MTKKRFLVRPLWQVICIHDDGIETVVQTLPTEEEAASKMETLLREVERLERLLVPLQRRRQSGHP